MVSHPDMAAGLSTGGWGRDYNALQHWNNTCRAPAAYSCRCDIISQSGVIKTKLSRPMLAGVGLLKAPALMIVTVWLPEFWVVSHTMEDGDRLLRW